jgi:hypothetical protein
MSKDEAFEALVQRIAARGDTYAYFFDRVHDPRWLEPLAGKGFFKSPPGIEKLEGGYLRFPIWPESRALARIADQAEDEVQRIILECPETDNPRVHEDFVDAALMMSPAKGAQLVPAIIDWLRTPYHLLLPVKTGELLRRLSEAGEVEGALTLARQLLALSEGSTPSVDEDSLGSRSKAIPLFDDWDYKRILEKDVPSLVRVARMRGLALLCDHLERATSIENAGGPPTDLSYVWRPSIADHDQNHDREPRDFLVSAIRDAATRMSSENLTPLHEIVELLVSRGWHVFVRLAMHVASEEIGSDARPGINLLLQRELFESAAVSHEYGLLLESAFPRASVAEQGIWLAWLEEGPDLTHFVELVTAETGEPPTHDELGDRADRWRWHRLAFIADEALSKDWRGRKATLAERFGQAPDMPVQTFSYVGSVSPLAHSEAAALSTLELAQYSDTIPTSADRFASPEEGFGDVLQELAQEQPDRMSEGILDFTGKKPLYVRSILQGLRGAVRTGSHLDWQAVVALAEWVMEQPREINGGSGGTYSDLDPGWIWTRSAIADLLEEGLRVRTVTLDLKERVWSLLQALLSDPDGGPSVSSDAATDSLNSIRGKAMHAVVLYASWVLEADRDTEELPTTSLSTHAPEVTLELDARLNSAVEPSLGVRAVFGMRLRLLKKLDPDWVASSAGRIFSVGEGSGFDALGAAAWGSYIKFGGSDLEIMRLLRPQYEIAVGSLQPTTPDSDEAERGLADHIMVMYWYGLLGDEPTHDSLVRELFQRGGVEVRHRALEFVGRSLREAGDELADDVGDRLKRLWEHRLERALTMVSRLEKSELSAFGWWMGSALDKGWAVQQLLEVLRIVREVDVDYLVVRALADVDGPHLEMALQCLVLIIQADKDGWGVYGWKDDAYRLIEMGSTGGQIAGQQLANDAANLLITRGFYEFRPLVQVQGER